MAANSQNLHHRLFTGSLVAVVVAVFFILLWMGSRYYPLPVETRFFHESHNSLKPSGSIGHGLGIAGSLCMVVGVSTYMVRKRSKRLARLGQLRYWLEFHIFLCSLGPLLVLFHTAFKFGGIVAVSFWSMVAVVLSGIAGRFIYNQIPRSIQGRELSLAEVVGIKADFSRELDNIAAVSGLDIQGLLKSAEGTEAAGKEEKGFKGFIDSYLQEIKTRGRVKQALNRLDIPSVLKNKTLDLIRNELVLRRKIQRLQQMQKLFRSWHVVHLPFALIMLVIMIVHVIITLALGYKWIF